MQGGKSLKGEWKAASFNTKSFTLTYLHIPFCIPFVTSSPANASSKVPMPAVILRGGRGDHEEFGRSDVECTAQSRATATLGLSMDFEDRRAARRLLNSERRDGGKMTGRCPGDYQMRGTQCGRPGDGDEGRLTRHARLDRTSCVDEFIF